MQDSQADLMLPVVVVDGAAGGESGAGVMTFRDRQVRCPPPVVAGDSGFWVLHVAAAQASTV